MVVTGRVNDNNTFYNEYWVESMAQGLNFVAHMMNDAYEQLPDHEYARIFGQEGMLNKLQSLSIEFVNIEQPIHTYENVSADMYNTFKIL